MVTCVGPSFFAGFLIIDLYSRTSVILCSRRLPPVAAQPPVWIGRPWWHSDMFRISGKLRDLTLTGRPTRFLAAMLSSMTCFAFFLSLEGRRHYLIRLLSLVLVFFSPSFTPFVVIFRPMATHAYYVAGFTRAAQPVVGYRTTCR